MRIEEFSFGAIRIDGRTYEHDVVIANGKVHKRVKKPSKHFKKRFGHTPVSLDENVPWECKRLVIGTGLYGQLPVMGGVIEEAQRRGIELSIEPTPEAIRQLGRGAEHTNAILHVTC